MKTVAASVVAAIAASACCLGPVVFSLVGAGALSAAAIRMEPYRPWFLAATAMLLVGAFVTTYRPQPDECADGVSCAPSSRRMAKTVLWLAVALVALLVTFPYYVARLF